MRKTIPAVAALALGALLAAFAATPTRAQDAPETVIDFANVLTSSAARLDQQITERQRLGQMAAAQRMVLAAAMIRLAAGEFRGAEQAELSSKVGKLPAPVRERLMAAIAKAAEAERAAGDQPAFIDGAQATFNALLEVLPIKAPHPVLYGLLSRDLAEPGTALPSDIVIYGHRIVDPVYKAPPVILHANVELPAANVVVNGDKILVSLPPEMKAAVGFAPPPCDARPSFGLRVREIYELRRGVWPLTWRTQILTNTDFYALPSPVLYSAKIVASSESVGATTTATVNFRRRSDLTIADCEETKAVEVVAPLPDDATDPTCSASWVDATGATKTVSRCVVEGREAHATGSITAGAKVCSPDKICTCTSLAQGWLEASGSYKRLQPSSEVKAAAESVSVTFPAGGMAQTRIPLEPGQVLRHVGLEISRRACDAVADSLELSLGEDPNATHIGTSRTGVFRAVISRGALSVGAVDAFPSTVDATP